MIDTDQYINLDIHSDAKRSYISANLSAIKVDTEVNKSETLSNQYSMSIGEDLAMCDKSSHIS